MIGHMRSRDSMTRGARRFSGGDVGGIPCGGMRSERSDASGADTHLAGRPGARSLDRAPGPVVEGMARFEQWQYVFSTVSRPDGKLPVPIQIERAAPVDGLEAFVPHQNSLRHSPGLKAGPHSACERQYSMAVLDT
jgi:hypothetical protein